MDRFGVKKPSLKALAGTPVIPPLRKDGDAVMNPLKEKPTQWMGATLHSLQGEEFSAFGVGKADGGVQLVKVPAKSAAALAGLRDNDLVQQVNGMKVSDTGRLFAALEKAGNAPIKLLVIRDQQPLAITMEASARK
jgi:S1-C subfamily serine protease